jgi:hypothetical protein
MGVGIDIDIVRDAGVVMDNYLSPVINEGISMEDHIISHT